MSVKDDLALSGLDERFWANVEKTDSCWNWLGSLNNTGYGSFYMKGIGVRGAHRFAYLAFVGPIPEGLQIDHLCRNRACVNPDHLEAVTPRVNQHRGDGFIGQNVRKTHCPNGHPYDAANTWHRDTRGKKSRICRACNQERMRRRRERRLAERLATPAPLTHFYYWRNNEKRLTLHNRHCRVLTMAKALNSVLVEFENGQREIVSRYAVRRLK